MKTTRREFIRVSALAGGAASVGLLTVRQIRAAEKATKPLNILILGGTIVVDYFAGIWLEKIEGKKEKDRRNKYIDPRIRREKIDPGRSDKNRDQHSQDRKCGDDPQRIDRREPD